MATTTVTLTGNVRDMLDGEYDARRTKVFLRHNTSLVVDPDAGVLRVGSGTVSVDDTGAFTLPDVIASVDTVENLQATVYVDYPDRASRERKVQTFGPYDLSAETGTVDLTELEATQHLDPSFASSTIAQMQALLDDMLGISGLTGEDAAVAALINGTGGAGPLSRAALSASIAQKAPVVIKPEQYGAVGDGTTDDTTAVVNAFAAATALRHSVIGGNVYAPGATVVLEGNYKLTTLAATIVASCNIDGSRGSLIAPAGFASAALLFGHETSGKVLQTATAKLPSVTKSGATAMTSGSVGVKVQNAYDCDIDGRRVDYFETGWWFTGLGQGTAYCRINLGRTDLCKVAYKLAPQTGGWVNSNRFVGGGISQAPNTLDGSGIRRSGWRHLVIDGSAGVGTVNSNTFDGVSYEGDLSEFFFDIKHASQNTWQGATRFEQGTAGRSTTLSTDTFTDASHGLAVGDMVLMAPTGLPGGMRREAYYVSEVPTSSTFKIAETKGGPTLSFTTNGSGIVYYVPPRIKIDGNGASNTQANEIKAGYFSLGQLDVRETNGATSNPVAPSLPRRGSTMPGRNRIINGDFRTNQRGYTSGSSLAVGAFAFDRWKSNQAATTLTFTSAPQGQPVFLDGYIRQVIERAQMPAGTYTLSWEGSAQGRIYLSGASAPSLSQGPSRSTSTAPTT